MEVRISELPAASSLTGTELVPIVQGGVTKRTTAADLGSEGASGGDFVEKATYDANSVLAATTDNLPVAVTVAEQRVLGRLTGAGIDDLNGTDLLSVLGVGLPQRSRPTHGATRAATTLGSLSTAWTDTVTVVTGQVVEYQLQISGTTSASIVLGVALSCNGTIIDRCIPTSATGSRQVPAALTGWHEPGAGTHTYEVLFSTSSGTFTIDATVDTSTSQNGTFSNDGLSALILQAVPA